VNTFSRHFALNFSTPYCSIAFFPPVSPSCFSTSISTGKPWVSQPAILVTDSPCIA
jgi:hypothetical protein